MKPWNKHIIGLLTGLGMMSAAHAGTYGPGSPATLTSVPAGFTLCGADYKVCKVPAGATAYVVYGKGNKWATAQGTGDFSCLPKGFVKFPSGSQPQDLGVDDPLPKTAKECHVKIAGGTAPPVPQPPVTPPAASTSGTSIPSGAVACATDGKKCDVSGAWTGVYGAGNKYAPIAGNGPFTCLPKGYVKTPSATTPPDTGIDDPAPGVQKTCHVVGKISAPTQTTQSSPPPSASSASPNCESAWDANGIKPNANCIYRTKSGKDYGSACPTESKCSCQCAANMATLCNFKGQRIREPVCKPGS
jgi:hypothetical protein